MNHQADISELAQNIALGLKLARTSMGIGAKGSMFEAKGWKEMLEGIKSPETRAFSALMLENYRRRQIKHNAINEASTTLNIASYDKWAFPLITMIAEDLVAQKLVTMQPMQGPTGNVFFMNFVTGQAKGNTPKGAKIWDARTSHADRASDSGDIVNQEFLASVTSTGVNSINLAYGPVMPGTVALYINYGQSNQTALRDDGNGNIINSTGTTCANIDYNTGALSGSANALTDTTDYNGLPITANYNYNAELNNTAQVVDFEIQSAPIAAQTKKLRGLWTQEAAFALEALFKEDAEDMISKGITNTLSFEIDRDVIEDLRRQAGAGVVQWSGNPPANVGYPEHKLTFGDALQTASSMIHYASNRARANWVLTGMTGSIVLETLPNFEPNGLDVDMAGVAEVGSYGHMKVFCDPRFPVNEVLLGYRGKDLVSTGYIYAPYILLYTTPTVQLDDMLNRKAFASMYAKRMVNRKFYSRMVLTNPQVQFGS
jgi:hypothetical protein